MRAAMIAVVRMLASLLKRHEPTSGTDNMKKMLILLTVAMATVANAQAQVILHGFSGAGGAVGRRPDRSRAFEDQCGKAHLQPHAGRWSCLAEVRDRFQGQVPVAILRTTTSA
jgi:hypothetical protein